MGSTRITTTFLLTSLSCWVLMDAIAWLVSSYASIPGTVLTGIARIAWTLSIISIALFQTGSLGIIGMGKQKLFHGLKQGMIWSFGFAVFACLLFIALFFAGINPLSLAHSPLPGGVNAKVIFFLVGGVIAPVAEEILFRGVIFGYLRRWGLTTAVLASTALFAALHLGKAIPVTQTVGGVVFALAYHRTGSLVAPMVIHMLGNLAIFTLSLPMFR